jgi:D-sedoheptulose 7-phosphate isomerase
MSLRFEEQFFDQLKKIVDAINMDEISETIKVIKSIKQVGGRIFFAGSGGGAGHASHAACDFRKLLDIECYSITDNVSELTARINDDGWETSYTNFLKVSNFTDSDAVFIFSVGGGSKMPPISMQLINVAKYAISKSGKVLSIVGRDGGEVKKLSMPGILIPDLDKNYVTAHTEGLQAYLWHMIVSHPDLNPNIPKWEGTDF